MAETISAPAGRKCGAFGLERTPVPLRPRRAAAIRTPPQVADRQRTRRNPGLHHNPAHAEAAILLPVASPRASRPPSRNRPLRARSADRGSHSPAREIQSRPSDRGTGRADSPSAHRVQRISAVNRPPGIPVALRRRLQFWYESTPLDTHDIQTVTLVCVSST